MGILYDLAIFPVKAVINSLQSSENSEDEFENKIDMISHANNVENVDCDKVRKNFIVKPFR